MTGGQPGGHFKRQDGSEPVTTLHYKSEEHRAALTLRSMQTLLQAQDATLVANKLRASVQACRKGCAVRHDNCMTLQLPQPTLLEATAASKHG
jgi:hypothetical protein